MAQLPWEEQTHSDVGRSILIWQSFTAWITMMLSNMLQRQQLIFFFTYWLSGLVIYSFFFSSIMDQGLSPDIWRGGVTCQWWKPLPKENKRSSDVHPQHILICRLTVAQIFIFYLFGWQHAVSLHFQMISCKLLKFACLTIWCYVRKRDLFLAGYVCIVWSDCLFCVFKKETWH